MARQVLSPDTVHKPTTYYSHAVLVENVVYLAGQAPHDVTGAVWDPADPAGQVRRVFENMAEVLKAAQAGFSDVVRLTILLRRTELAEVVWQVAREYLETHRPAITVATVDGLAGSDYLLEMDAVAIIDPAPNSTPGQS